MGEGRSVKGEIFGWRGWRPRPWCLRVGFAVGCGVGGLKQEHTRDAGLEARLELFLSKTNN
eukprot:scaffold42858_cov61-Cyclotella_meneghiniana.AAC.5